MRFVVPAFALLLAACPTETIGQATVSLAMQGVAADVKTAPTLSKDTTFRPHALQPNQIAGISFTPESVLVPITRITLDGYIYTLVGNLRLISSNLSPQEVYRCPGAKPEDCLVDISSPDALRAFNRNLTNITVVEGDYETVSVYNGFEGTDGFVKGSMLVKGFFSLQGVTYYTSATGPVTEATAYDYLNVEISKGAWTFPIQANGSLALTPNSSALVSLFTNNDALLYGLQISTLDADENDCAANAALEIAVCATEPAVVGFIGETAPSLEHYALNFSGSGWYDGMTGLLVVVLDAERKVIGILPKQYLTGATGAKTPNFFGAVESFTVNTDGSIDMVKGSEGNPGYFKLDGFLRENHAGNIVLEEQGAGRYTAEKQ